MFNQLKEMGNLAKKAKEMKDKMKKIQLELKSLKVESTEGGITVVMTGEMDCVGVRIDDSVANGSKDVLQKNLVKAFNSASQKSKKLASSKLSVVSQGLNIPGL